MHETCDSLIIQFLQLRSQHMYTSIHLNCTTYVRTYVHIIVDKLGVSIIHLRMYVLRMFVHRQDTMKASVEMSLEQNITILMTTLSRTYLESHF